MSCGKKEKMSKSPRQNSIALIREIIKHAKRDGCYKCKRLLRAMGIDPDKEFPPQID